MMEGQDDMLTVLLRIGPAAGRENTKGGLTRDVFASNVAPRGLARFNGTIYSPEELETADATCR